MMAVYGAEPIEMPACAGVQNGVRIQQGVRGLLARVGDDEAADMIVEPARYCYKIMTHSERGPVLIGEKI